jgi:hypothetical protein
MIYIIPAILSHRFLGPSENLALVYKYRFGYFGLVVVHFSVLPQIAFVVVSALLLCFSLRFVDRDQTAILLGLYSFRFGCTVLKIIQIVNLPVLL